jgi:hypothetical protein
MNDPAEALERLCANDRVLLFGVRHHSPACSHAIVRALDAFGPARVLIELPVDYAPWIEHLAHPELVAPVALAGVREEGDGLSFYPFADFSPELAAMRWARAANVPIEPIDLPLGAIVNEPHVEGHEEPAFLAALLDHFEAPDGEHLWDHVVEARAPGADHERVRRAGLLVGWALRRQAAGHIRARDLARERFMRERIAATDDRVAVVVGAFHAPALIDPPMFYDEPAPAPIDDARFVTSLVPYAFDLLDARSGYPAGIRDPSWQDAALRAMGDPDALDAALADAVVHICKEVRRRGHVAGVPDANEAVRVARDLARLRSLPAPSRRELLEAIETCLGQGELLGRGRVLARACDVILVGKKRGALAPGTPRSGLSPHVEALVLELRLPGPDAEEATLRLDPLRSELDRRRHATLMRMRVCSIDYATPAPGRAAGNTDTLTHVWLARWRPSTSATIELAGIRGVTLRQAAAGALTAHEARVERAGALTAGARIELLSAAAECGLGDRVTLYLRAITGPFLGEATLVDLVNAIALVDRIVRGHVPALPIDEATKDIDRFVFPADVDPSVLVASAVRAIDGIEGSDRVDDARALLEIVRLIGERELGDSRLGWAMKRIAGHGAPLVAGAAAALCVVLGRSTSRALGEAIGAWIDGAVDAAGRRRLALRLRGVLVVSAPLLEAQPDALDGLCARVEALSDAEFLARASALREAFDVLSPAARQRLLSALSQRLGARDPTGRGLDVFVDEDAGVLARYAKADLAGKEAMARWPT